jgi:type IV secretion system protein VirB6
LRAALTIMVVLLVMVAVSVQLFRIGRTIVAGWTLGFGATIPLSMPSGASPITADTAPAQMVYNERMQALVGSIERAAVTASSGTSVAPQRQVLLPLRGDITSVPAAAAAMQGDRRVARGRVAAVRAPIKPVRNAA